jgi:hypothetical protein
MRCDGCTGSSSAAITAHLLPREPRSGEKSPEDARTKKISQYKKQRRNNGRPIQVNISIEEKQNSFRFNVNSPGEQLFERD